MGDMRSPTLAHTPTRTPGPHGAPDMHTTRGRGGHCKFQKFSGGGTFAGTSNTWWCLVVRSIEKKALASLQYRRSSVCGKGV